MLHRPADSRLLSNLLSHERDYLRSLRSQLDYGQDSLASFSAYAAASPPPASRAITAVAAALIGANDSLRGYVLAVEEWCEHLKMLKDMEDEVGNIARDREILVDRLIKASKSNIPKRRSIISSGTSSLPNASVFSFSGPTLEQLSFSNSKLNLAQNELQACETHLTEKERILAQMRETSLVGGLKARCKALVECGWKWAEVGKVGLQTLDSSFTHITGAHPGSPFNKPLPDPHDLCSRPSSDLCSSLAPSQSASQIVSADVFSERHHLSSGSASGPISRGPLPEADIRDDSSQFALTLPPAHAISEQDHYVPPRVRVPDSAENDICGSSDEEGTDGRVYEVHENPVFSGSSARAAGARPKTTASSSGLPLKRQKLHSAGGLPSSISAPLAVDRASNARARKIDPHGPFTSANNHFDNQDSPRRRKRTTFLSFGVITGLFHKRDRAASLSSVQGTGLYAPPSPDKGGQWLTRTDQNLKTVVKADDSSDDEAGKRNAKPVVDYEALRQKNVIEAKGLPNPTRSRLDPPAVGARSRSNSMPTKKGPTGKKLKKAMDGTQRNPSGADLSKLPSAPGEGREAGKKLTTEASNLSQSKNARIELAVSSPTAPVSRSSTILSRSTSKSRSSRRAVSLDIPSSASDRRRTDTRSNLGRAAPGRAHPLASNSGSAPAIHGQASLMSIVEDVSRQNRQGWLQVNPNNLLVEIRAPKSVYSDTNPEQPLPSPTILPNTKTSPYGKGVHVGKGRGTSSMLLHSADVHRLSTISASSSEPSLPLKDLLTTQSVQHEPVAPKRPLRSALRTRTPSPNPLALSTLRPGSPAQRPGTGLAGVGPIVTPVPHHFDPSPRLTTDDDDASTVSSAYETGHEDLEEASDAPPTPPPHEEEPRLPNGLVSGSKSNGMHLSASVSVSSSGGTATPSRRKSVRVSSNPTFSPTPPALTNYEEDHTPWASSSPKDGSGNNAWPSRVAEPNTWEDSSEEDEAYSRARQMLYKASKKLEKVVHWSDLR